MIWTPLRSNGLRCRALILASIVMLLLLSGCASLFPEQHRSGRGSGDSRSPQRQSVRTGADARDQQHYYDIGLQHYSKENYDRAKRAFQHVVDMGPSTPLGLKAQENLKKIQQIEKTLQEIESK
ncbi:MAG: hypothetical protein OEW15_03755 [Nitrospirota bacterium]|nr:hypothetical protein [Nitrospirota bacterium]